jgi:hypothetical protein
MRCVCLLQVMNWVHGLSRLVSEARKLGVGASGSSGGSGKKSGGSGKKSGGGGNNKEKDSAKDGHKAVQWLWQSRRYRADMMWNKLLSIRSKVA